MKSSFTHPEAGVGDLFCYLTFRNCTSCFVLTFSEVPMTPSIDFCSQYHSPVLSTWLNSSQSLQQKARCQRIEMGMCLGLKQRSNGAQVEKTDLQTASWAQPKGAVSMKEDFWGAAKVITKGHQEASFPMYMYPGSSKLSVLHLRIITYPLAPSHDFLFGFAKGITVRVWIFCLASDFCF